MLIQSERVWLAGQFLPAQIEFYNHKITNIFPHGQYAPDIDYGTQRILPGFIDIHTHGAYGFDTNDGEPDGLRHWLEHVTEEGVTSILPTTVTQMPDVLLNAVTNVANVVAEGYTGAEVLGIHFEGPFLDMDYKGAQPPEAIAVPSVEQMEQYVEASGNLIRYITLAPEHDTNYALTHWCKEHDIVVSMGHSSATFQEAVMAIANGATSMTHVFNGMTSFHHRKPGLVGTALRTHNIFGEVICDGHHVSPEALNVFFHAKGLERPIMVTDSLRVKGADPHGTYDLGGHEIELGPDGLARLKGSDTIAGSTLRMNEGLRVLIEEAGVPEEAAINSCTINPARCLHVDNRKGKLCAGYDADIVVLDDDYSVTAVYCKNSMDKHNQDQVRERIR